MEECNCEVSEIMNDIDIEEEMNEMERMHERLIPRKSTKCDIPNDLNYLSKMN